MSESSESTLRSLEGGTSVTDALALFDALPAVSVPDMLGRWKGSGLTTGNPLDGLLEAYHWHGKRFDPPDDAQPLIFADRQGLFSVNPAGLPLTTLLRWGQSLSDQRLARTVGRILRLRQTSRPTARLRMMEFRGVVTGTMIYDALPINDHFRTAGPDTLLGAMDLRGLDAPFFFVLRRETTDDNGA